ncbi:MAG: ABC-2 type transport system permease protein [Lentisphaeria bacterium]|jgi:ABC-2 type transport system permease protein
MNYFYFLFRGSMMTVFAYRTWMLTASAANLLYIVVVYQLWRAIYSGSEQLNNMSFDQSFLYLSLAGTLFAVFKTTADYSMSADVSSGMITNYLLKPIDHQLYLLADNLGRVALNVVFVMIPAFVLVVGVFGVSPPFSVDFLWFLPAFLMAYCISFFIDYSVGCVAFYTESIWGIFTTKDTLVMVLSGVTIPFAFFPNWLQEVLIWSPFVAIYHTPVSILMGTVESTSQLIQMISNQLLWILVLLASSRLFFKKSSQALVVNGG